MSPLSSTLEHPPRPCVAPISRRSLLLLGGATLAASVARGASVVSGASASRSIDADRIRAVAFDAFAIFDLRALWRACEYAFPGQGSALGAAWRSRQFEYQWLGALAGKYQDFWETTLNALIFAARSTGISLSDKTRDSLMHSYLRMAAWPDVAKVISQLRASGRQVLILSNATDAILDASSRSNGLHGAFDHVLSTDRIASFKPDPKAYQMAVDRTGNRREEILFVAFAGWDAAGARWFGYPTFWNNRLSAPMEELGVSADAVGSTLRDLIPLLHLEAISP
jgi:2-haloacid dehalogenase